METLANDGPWHVPQGAVKVKRICGGKETASDWGVQRYWVMRDKLGIQGFLGH